MSVSGFLTVQWGLCGRVYTCLKIPAQTVVSGPLNTEDPVQDPEEGPGEDPEEGLKDGESQTGMILDDQIM